MFLFMYLFIYLFIYVLLDIDTEYSCSLSVPY